MTMMDLRVRQRGTSTVEFAIVGVAFFMVLFAVIELSRGGCRVSTDTSRIDATVENRVNAVIAEVLGGERDVD